MEVIFLQTKSITINVLTQKKCYKNGGNSKNARTAKPLLPIQHKLQYGLFTIDNLNKQTTKREILSKLYSQAQPKP